MSPSTPTVTWPDLDDKKGFWNPGSVYIARHPAKRQPITFRESSRDPSPHSRSAKCQSQKMTFSNDIQLQHLAPRENKANQGGPDLCPLHTSPLVPAKSKSLVAQSLEKGAQITRPAEGKKGRDETPAVGRRTIRDDPEWSPATVPPPLGSKGVPPTPTEFHSTNQD